MGRGGAAAAMIRTEDALKTCQDVQHIIDITSEHLDRLRWGGEVGGKPAAMILTAEALKTCQDVQHIIDITSQHLDRLR